jgi:hypothetical protein
MIARKVHYTHLDVQVDVTLRQQSENTSAPQTTVDKDDACDNNEHECVDGQCHGDCEDDA